MALPQTVSSGLVTGTFIDGAGVPLTGSVDFRPEAPYTLESGTAIIVAEPINARLIDGRLSITLAATDDADINPVGWTWRAIPRLDGVRFPAFSFSLPSGATIDLSDVVPIPSSTGTPTVVGPAGPANLVVGPDNTLTEPGLWVQTFPNGDMTFWIEDGQ